MRLNFRHKRNNRTCVRGRLPAARVPPYRPALVALEDRLVPATHVWIGPASGGLWSNAANWTNGTPQSGEAGGTIVQFNGGIDSIQDFNSFMAVDQIHFTAGGNTIHSALGVTMGISSNLPVSILNDAGTNTLDASLPLDIVSQQPILVQVTAGQLNVNGNLFDDGKSGLIVSKTSAGNVVLGGSLHLANNAPNTALSVNAGVLSLTGYSPNNQGITQADNATLMVTGYYPNSPFDLLASATLAGTGTVQSILTIFGLGNVVSPGGAGTIGSLTIAPGVTTSQLKASTFQVDLANPGVSDQLIVGNSATLDLTGSTLGVNVLSSAMGNVYTIVRNATGELSGTITGTFTGLADGATLLAAGRTFRIHYTATAVTLTDLGDTPNAIFVSNVYNLLLGRVPDAGAQVWVNLLNNGASPATVVQDIEQTTEYRTDVVASLYQHYLKRGLDPFAQGWINLLAAGASIEFVTAGIVASPEYLAAHGGTSTGFVQGLYQDILGRAGSAGEVQIWVNTLSSGASRTQVALALLTSAEYRTDLVDGDYSKYLLRSADAAGQAAWLQALASGMADQTVLAGILGSPEGFALWS
jgi:hypothetical protein